MFPGKRICQRRVPLRDKVIDKLEITPAFMFLCICRGNENKMLVIADGFHMPIQVFPNNNIVLLMN